MNRVASALAALVVAVVAICGPVSALAESFGTPPADLGEKLDRLAAAYPAFVAGHKGNDLLLVGGTRLPISDGRANKSFNEMVEHPDIDDMFFAPYPAGAEASAPGKNIDPGRIRDQALFDHMYGNCAAGEVSPHLRRIAWLPKHRGGQVSISSVNGADMALEAVSAELDGLPEAEIKYLIPNAGTYNCRKVAGQDTRSAHSWGIAIDINSSFSDYWLWSAAKGREPVWKNRIPMDIVRIFEKHGFIWGGRWYHYDTMHFEYRPELLP